MMAPFKLNCPRCSKQLVHVPLDSLTLYYQCPEHGAVILQPLVPVDDDEEDASDSVESHLQGHDASASLR